MLQWKVLLIYVSISVIVSAMTALYITASSHSESIDISKVENIVDELKISINETNSIVIELQSMILQQEQTIGELRNSVQTQAQTIQTLQSNIKTHLNRGY